MALKPLIWLCLWAGAACELLIVRGPVDLEAGRGVSALDLWSISGAWLELAAAGWGLSDICFLGQVWDWHIRRLIHWFYHRFAAFRYYMTILCNPDATSILCHEWFWCSYFLVMLLYSIYSSVTECKHKQICMALYYSTFVNWLTLYCALPLYDAAACMYQGGSQAHTILTTVGLYPVLY